MPFPSPPDGPIPPLAAALTTAIPAPTPTSLTMQNMKDILLPAEVNIMKFMPGPPPPPPPIPDPPELPMQINAIADKTADQLSKALFPFLQIMIVQLANQIIDERISAQLDQLQTDVNAIKRNLGI